MNPQSLKLRNYRAFAEADLDLSSVECAAVVGPNGAGKSTVCEAILWTLFGESRSSGVDGVVKLGEQEASVELTYAHGDNLYRVIRKRSRDKRSTLDYLLMDEEEWKPLTGASIADTQARIERDLAMNKELFLASSCVTQGNSAGICEATPAERKAILMQLLEDRLARFGPLAEAAKARRKTLDQNLDLGRAKRDGLEVKIEMRKIDLGAKQMAEARIIEAQAALTNLEAARAALVEAQIAQKADRERLADLNRQIAAVEGEIAGCEGKITLQRTVIESAEDLLKNAAEIREQCGKADELEAKLGELDALREKHRELRDAYVAKENELKRDRDRLEADAGRLAQRRMDTAATLERHQKTHELVATVPCAECEHQGDCNGRCQLLTQARCAGDDAVKTRAALKGIDEEIQSNFEAVKVLDDRFAAELDPIHAEGKALNYDAETHQQVQDLYAVVKPARELLPRLTGAEERAKAAGDVIRDLEAGISYKASELADLAQHRNDLQQKIGGDAVPDHAYAIAVKDREITGVKADLGRANVDLGACDERLKQIDEATVELEGLAQTIQADEHGRLVYATLEEAFSRDGIPALVIDAAIPEIEETANDILSRLSDGRMTIKLVTQKQTQTAGIRETLDIVIADAEGERPYEDFSGGERLRIDLAVRIALGRMLATRTGAQIETLILDEVAAPLDEAGRDSLLDCVNRLRSSFGCILLITHHEDLKDRLPTQIIVAKDGAGSTVQIAA